ncbi:MAG: hypothetical protein Ct9H300mP1_39200 [Planctomycetaceae bacterium]|nr:MAG: hypothetical protein Ct9H300mP1_39200 [Planctomycetaceae bacterium]
MRTRTSYLKFHAALDRLPDFSRYFPDSYDPRYIPSMKICPRWTTTRKPGTRGPSGRPASEPVMEVQIPSVIDDTLTEPGRHVMSVWGLYAPVQPQEGDWDELRESVGESLIDVLCRYAPDLRDCLIDWSFSPPADLERRVWLTEATSATSILSPNSTSTSDR